MAPGRTTIILGDKERRAAKKLAAHWGVSPSEAIRRALLKVEADEFEAARSRTRRDRVAAFEELIKLFDGYDPQDELNRIREDRNAW
jgi:hypothetical protein